ncbi:MAG: ParB/RepB/Spo0J family partition protein [Lactobacillales bacterium]|jgi:ParB family chromosome partitioning protein|nr:ParB/RepB/Spo0J family partition protein [Lactobacillales bacterium]
MDKSLGKGKSLGLGKGLSTLMGGEVEAHFGVAESQHFVTMVDISLLHPGVFQPRQSFDIDSLGDLVNSIREKGVLQPLLVRKHPKKAGAYEVIAGERRLRASKTVGLEKVPVLIKEFDDKTTLEVALIENLQREDLNPFDEAGAYIRLMEEFKYTQEALSKVVGKSRSHIANMMRLLDLPEVVKDYVLDKKLTIGHARALLGGKDIEALAKEIIKKGLNVRQTEKLAAEGMKGKVRKTGSAKQQKDADIVTLEKELTRILKTPVAIDWTGKGGKVVISYQDLDQLDFILQSLMQAEVKG